MSQELNLVEAVNQALKQELTRDESVFVLGEDVGEFGGAFKATQGLFQEFGRRRVLDTPMSEWAVIGMAAGAAIQGLRPIVEIQFADFISTGFDTLVQYSATAHYRWGAKVPMVVRAPWGGGNRAGPFHSQCTEAWLAHTPGLKVVIPSNPVDAKGLLISAIRDDNPVVFFEPKHLYRKGRASVPEESYSIPLGKASVPRHGRDLSIITYGAMVPESLDAASRLASENIDCEVIDLRTVSPLDMETIEASVKKTAKVLIVHEARKSCGIGSEIAARLSEHCFYWLDAPVMRLTAPDTPVPYAPDLEDAYRPGAERIANYARKLAKH